MTQNESEKKQYLKKLIAVWEKYGNTEEELLIEDLDLDVQVETVEHMLTMKGLDFRNELEKE